MKKFWNNASGSFKIDPEALHGFLTENGFYTYKPETVKTSLLVKVENNWVRQVSPKEIREFCWRYIESEFQFQDEEERKLIKIEFQRNKSYFSKDNIELLPKIEINEIEDTDEISYLFFNNCILQIIDYSVTKKTYEDIEGHVFETDIIDFDYTTEFSDDYEPSGDFFEFIKDICKNKNKIIEEQNFSSIKTIIGYLLHRYKDPGNAKAIIFMDTIKDGNPNGSTGKGILTHAFENIRKTAFQDGKFYSSKDRFSFSHVEYGTRILVFDDVPKNFDFEKIFPLITEKAVIERKHENKFIIPFNRSPKVLITTNYTILGKGESHKRRRIEFIFSDTYTADYTPEDKFGHLLFNEWDKTEWEKFYSFIVHCLMYYLLIELDPPKFNVAERKLLIEATGEFIDFANKGLDFKVKYNKKTLYEEFYSKNPNHYKVELTTFRNWLKLFAEAYGFGFYETRSGDNLFFELTTD